MNRYPISDCRLQDCMVGMKRFPDKYFDWAVPDPPYGIGAGTMNYVSRGNITAKQKSGKRIALPPKLYTQSDFDITTPPQEYFDELCRVSKHQIVFGIDHFDWSGVGPGRIKWDKLVPAGVGFSRYENAYCSLIDHEIEVKLLWSGMMQAESLQHPMIPKRNKALNEKRIHPTQKPVLLYAKIFSMFTKPGDKILDTHLGSRSSAIAAYKLGLDFWGFEIDPGYYWSGEKRFQQSISLPLFDSENGIIK